MIDETLKNANILIVDDQEANVEVLEGFLAMDGYRNVKTTTNPLKALEMLDTFKPDLLLLDLVMPHMSGFEVMSILKEKLSPLAFFPILVLTADVTDEAKIEALSGGATDFLTKPFNLIEVGLRIKNLLFSAYLNQQLISQNKTLEERVRERTAELEEKNRELIKAKEKAEASERLKSAFLANISHEIRTPMNGILGFADLLKNNLIDKDNLLEYLGIIEKSGNRLMNTIDDIVSISKIETDNYDLYISRFSVREIMENICYSFEPEASDKNLPIYLHKPEGMEDPIVQSDQHMFTTIVSHLLRNAIKFTNVGRIDMGYSIKSGVLNIYVRDTGIGIPPDKQEDIFDRFVQEDFSVSKIYEGTGLGLAIVKAYVNMLDGVIWVDSEDDKGSTFYFSIPVKCIKRENIVENSASLDENNIDNILKDMTLLITDDDKFSRLYLSKLLENRCRNIYFAESGEEAIEIYKKNRPINLVLMDIILPKIDGHDTAKKIREIDPDALIVAHTGLTPGCDIKNNLSKNFDGYLAKPIKKQSLYQLILNKCSQL